MTARKKSFEGAPVGVLVLTNLALVVPFVLGLNYAIRDFGISQRPVRAVGDVVTLTKSRGLDEGTVRFQVGAERVTGSFETFRRVRIGDRVEIEYNASHPADARLAGDVAMRNLGWFLLVVSIAFPLWMWASWLWALWRPTPDRGDRDVDSLSPRDPDS